MRPHVQEALDALLKRRLTRASASVETEPIEAQRRRFLAAFAPERLHQLSAHELLRQVPYNSYFKEPLDYWLESRTDAVFNTRLFGTIAGGSVAKFGLWQDNATGQWRTRNPGSRHARPLSEDQALQIVDQRRREIINAAAALNAITAGHPPHEQDPKAVQQALAAAAPRNHGSAWLHKYLHILFPDYVTCFATAARLQAALYRLGAEARGSGLYALDIRLLHYLQGLTSLNGFPAATRYRLFTALTPRDHWCFCAPGAALQETLLASGCIALEPAAVGNVAGPLSMHKKTDAEKGLKLAFCEAGIVANPKQIEDLLNLGYSLKPGSLIGLCSNARTVIAVGEVQDSYCYSFTTARPHRIPVRWLHQQPFTLTQPVGFSRGSLLRLPPQDRAVVELEGSLLLNGIWSELDGAQPRWHSCTRPASAPELPPPEPRVQHLLGMLTRKNQIILYGPPGTGKTHYAEQVAWEMLARRNFSCTSGQLSPSQRAHILGQREDEPQLVVCTFHPMFAYEDFIEGYRPAADGFVLKPGILRRLAVSAEKQLDKHFVLIIDEINRGNIPQIFGEAITLLEPGRRGHAFSHLSLSGTRFTLPPNLFIIATMNTADRSISLLDSGLRRRFGFMELLPEPELLDHSRIGAVTLCAWLRALNRRLRERLGREGRHLQVGHAYFMAAGKPMTAIGQIAAVIREDIWPLLQEYCYEDSEALAAILNADQGGLYDRDSADLRHELFAPDQETALCKAIATMVTRADKATAPDEDTAAEATLGRVDKISLA